MAPKMKFKRTSASIGYICGGELKSIEKRCGG
jgi:hypothetical protein